MQTFPMALAIGLQVASGIAGYVGQQTAADQQKNQNEQLRQNAIQSRDNDLATIEARRQEEQSAAAQKAQLSQQQALQERSSALAAQAQAGQTGLSVNALLADHLRKELENEQTIRSNLSNVNSQLDRERLSVTNTAQGRVNAAPSITNPSFLGSALKIGSDAYTTYQVLKPPTKPTVPSTKAS